MKQRMDIGQVDPAAYRALAGLTSYLKEAALNPTHHHLIRIRASQLNGCGYCLDTHIAEAKQDGESDRRLHSLALWRESPFFTVEEKILLALTDEVTHISGRVSDATWNQALALWGERRLSQTLMAIIAIGAWNRIGVATEMAPR